jgi:hypothetical protein
VGGFVEVILKMQPTKVLEIADKARKALNIQTMS